jgi:dolichol kinase
MGIPLTEIKRKLFHNLSLIYIAIYWVCPRTVSLFIFGAGLAAATVVEFIRLRRPEVNAWLIQKFGGIHRPHEIMHRSGIFWTLFGVWITILAFTNKAIVLSALGFLALGDTAAALGGKKWGKHPWPTNPTKTYEGSVCFVVVSTFWGILFLRPHIAFMGAIGAALIESRWQSTQLEPCTWRLPGTNIPIPGNDNFWIPFGSGVILSLLNLALGRL